METEGRGKEVKGGWKQNREGRGRKWRRKRRKGRERKEREDGKRKGKL
jgi:hypothetical protein